MPRFKIESEEHWHDLRARHVGGSEIAALFGLSPHTTIFQLWHRKAGNLAEPDLSDDDRVFWGTVLEPAIAMGAAKKKLWNVRNVRTYWTHPSVKGMGANLDYEIVNHDNGAGCLEIKTVDRLTFRDWEDEQPPMSYELQLQHQCAVTGRAWGAIAVLVGGNELRVYERRAHAASIAKIEEAVEAFWASINEGREPQPDFEADSATIFRLFHETEPGRFLDMTGDNYLMEVCAAYTQASGERRRARRQQDAARAEILTKIGTAEKVICGPFSISAKEIAETHVDYTREAYRDFRVHQRQQQDGAPAPKPAILTPRAPAERLPDLNRQAPVF